MLQKANIKKLKELSVFFPCYNEAANMPALMSQALEIIPRVAERYEIIIVNDGSSDSTSVIAHYYATKYPFIKVIDQPNQGYGGALNTGFKTAQYEWVFFTDADLQFDLTELIAFVANVTEGTDLLIGYRKNRAEGFVRHFLALGMKVWNAIFLGFPLFIKDIDCAFKLIRRDVIQEVGELTSRGNLVTSEFLLKAYRCGYTFHQLGVTHYKRVAGISTCGGLPSVIKVIRETFVLRRRMPRTVTVVPFGYRLQFVRH